MSNNEYQLDFITTYETRSKNWRRWQCEKKLNRFAKHDIKKYHKKIK